MKLQDLLVDVKTTWVEYPGCPGFEVEIAGLSRKELMNLRKSCMIGKIDRKTRQPYQELDEDKFVSEFSRSVIKGWKGFKVKYLEELVLVDSKGVDLESEIDYDQDSAEALVQNSTEFDNWLNDVVFDLDTFRTRTAGAPVGEIREVDSE